MKLGDKIIEVISPTKTLVWFIQRVDEEDVDATPSNPPGKFEELERFSRSMLYPTNEPDTFQYAPVRPFLIDEPRHHR